MMTKSWKDIRSTLTKCSERDLVGLIQDLYRLDKRNKDFLHARFTNNAEIIQRYIFIVKECFAPKQGHEPWDITINLAGARKAINDYKKAIGDEAGVFELMVVYAESGVKFLIEFCSDNSAYYASIHKMIGQLLASLQHDTNLQVKYEKRMRKMLIQAEQQWGITHYIDNELLASYL